MSGIWRFTINHNQLVSCSFSRLIVREIKVLRGFALVTTNRIRTLSEFSENALENSPVVINAEQCRLSSRSYVKKVATS